MHNIKSTFGLAVVIFMLTACKSNASGKNEIAKDIAAQENVVQEDENIITDFTLSTPEGQPLSAMSEVKKNKITLLDFWASWCPPCRQEMPVLVELYRKYHERGFGIVGISLDNNKAAWTQGIENLGIVWPQMSDLKGWDNEAAQLFQVNAIPFTILVDSEGRILAQGLRGMELVQFVASHLSE